MVNNQVKKNSNLWDGKFRDKELKLYSKLTQKDIDIILNYQKILPILQEDTTKRIDGEKLHSQLEVGRDYTTWIKGRIKKYDFIENEDYILTLTKTGERKNVTKHQYYLTLEMAKELCMIENNAIGRMSRKYFIAIEKAFKERVEWNKDRQGSINAYYNLREIVFKDLYGDNYLEAWIPSWWNITETKTGRKNSYAYELYRIDLVIINMSAQEYRRINNLNKGIAIRNTFTEEQLEDFEVLQSKSAEYLFVNKIWNTDERMKMLRKFYEYYKGLSV